MNLVTDKIRTPDFGLELVPESPIRTTEDYLLTARQNPWLGTTAQYKSICQGVREAYETEGRDQTLTSQVLRSKSKTKKSIRIYTSFFFFTEVPLFLTKDDKRPIILSSKVILLYEVCCEFLPQQMRAFVPTNGLGRPKVFKHVENDDSRTQDSRM